jgi:hypothetical protein
MPAPSGGGIPSMVPLADHHAVSVGMLTVDDQVCFGIYADRRALPDVDLLAQDIDDALTDLARPPERRTPRPGGDRRMVERDHRRPAIERVGAWSSVSALCVAVGDGRHAASGRCVRVVSVNGKSAFNALVGLRLAVGAASWLTPGPAGKLFGLDLPANPQAPYLARLFGARDVALAWGSVSSAGDARRQWLLAGLACDLADAAAGVAGRRGGYLPKLTSVLVTGTAVAAVGLGAAALAEQ